MKAIIYYLYSNKQFSEHIMREFGTILDPIFIKTLSSIDLGERNKIMPESDHKWQFTYTSDS